MTEQVQELTTYSAILLELNPSKVECTRSKNSNMYMCLLKRGDSVVGEEIIPDKNFSKFQSACISYALVKSLQSEYGISKLSRTSIILPSVAFPSENESIWTVTVKLNSSFKASDVIKHVEVDGTEQVDINLDVDFV